MSFIYHYSPQHSGRYPPSVIPSEPRVRFDTVAFKQSSPRRQTIVSELLAGLDHVPFDREAAQKAARLRVELERRGLAIGPTDLLITGTALSRNATLVTNNTKEFSRIMGLRLSDWTA